ncbi:sulfotransferase [Caenibius sp. WL]|uniref:sulfotransferase family protein n=1 Tax=Caenibius sp. WL TaxID=2872646 RepID=UPI001C98EB3B|nr:sulfotransferase [Caenibius sp. WL]QZP09220.1 sulfotransferase [Caenibius sp. WL]
MQNLAQLEPDALMARAKANTGLDDFGPDHFLEPLTVLTRSMREEADLNEAGIQMQGGRIVNALENRLRRQALMKAHPEIADEKVEVGAIIVGLPRTGSTMLHRLLAASPRATAMVWWETIFPLPRDESGAADIAARKADAEALVEQLVGASAGFDAIHPMDAHAYDEELPLIEQSFISNIPEAMMYLPSYGAWLLEADQRAAYGELIDWLKILQWQDPSRRGQKWVLKAPHHLTAVQTVLDMFPEAVIVMTHRRIDHVIASYSSMVGSLTGGNTDTDFRAAQARHWSARLKRNLEDMMAARRNAEDRFVDVDYRKLLADPVGHAIGIFATAGIHADDADVAAWKAWLDGNKRDNRPSHKYELADFGIDAEQLSREFAFYTNVYGSES